MFCKKCGKPNPDDARFCMSCGAVMSVAQKTIAATPKVNIKEPREETVANRTNAFQKILFLIALVWIVVSFFYIPYRDGKEIVFDTLWAGRSEKVDLMRAIFHFGAIFILTYLLYRYLRRFNTLEVPRYKKIARRELYLFFLFVLSVFICGAYLFSANFINKKRDQKLAEQIPPLEQKIEKNSQKRKIRSAFWDEAKTVYHLREFDNKINRYWDFLMVNMEDETWLGNFYNSFNKKTYNYYYDNNYQKKYYVDDEFNSLNRKFGLNNPNALKNFIAKNSLTTDDFKKDEENKTLGDTLNKLRDEKSRLSFYDNKDFRHISLTTLIIVFALLYILRPLIWFIKGLLTEIK